jgi:tetratricopeptide (TPR) repeat protein
MDELSAKASREAAAWFEQGEALFKQEHYEEALAAYERAIELDPLDARFF